MTRRPSGKMKNIVEHRLEMVAAGLSWPEGPTVLPDGRLVFVESYRSQLTVLGSDRIPRRFAYVAGAPNSCVLGTGGWVYVCRMAEQWAPGEQPRWSPRRFRGCAKEVWPRSWLRRSKASG